MLKSNVLLPVPDPPMTCMSRTRRSAGRRTGTVVPMRVLCPRRIPTLLRARAGAAFVSRVSLQNRRANITRRQMGDTNEFVTFEEQARASCIGGEARPQCGPHPDNRHSPVWCITNNRPFVAPNLACGQARRRKHPRSGLGLRSNTATGRMGRNPLGGSALGRMLCGSILTYPCGYARPSRLASVINPLPRMAGCLWHPTLVD